MLDILTTLGSVGAFVAAVIAVVNYFWWFSWFLVAVVVAALGLLTYVSVRDYYGVVGSLLVTAGVVFTLVLTWATGVIF